MPTFTIVIKFRITQQHGTWRNINISNHNTFEVTTYCLTPLEFLVLNPQFDVVSLVIGLIKHFSRVDLNALIRRSLLLLPFQSR